MRQMLPLAIALSFQLIFIGMLSNVLSGIGVGASPGPPPPTWGSAWNDLVPRGAWHEVVRRQMTSGNRTKDLYDFFAPDDPPAQCSLDCEIIWGVAGSCDFRSCTCTEANGAQFVRCCDCLIAPDPSPAKVDYYQGILTEFQADYCADYRVPPLTLHVPSASGTSNPLNTSGPTLAGSLPPALSPTPSNPPAITAPTFANGALGNYPKVVMMLFLLGMAGVCGV